MRFAVLLPLVLATTALAGPFKRQQEARPACNRTPEVTLCRNDSECGTDERCQFVTRNPDLSGCNGACIKLDPAPSSSSSSSASSTSTSSTASPTPSPPAGNTCPFVFGKQQCRGNDCNAGQTCQFVTRNADGSGCDGYCADTTSSSSSTTSSMTTSSPTTAPSPVTTCAVNLDCPTTQYCNQKGQCATYADCRATADSCPGGACTNERPLSGPTYQAIRDPYQPFICSFNSTSSSSSSSSMTTSSSSSTVSPTSSVADCRTTGCDASDYCVFVKQGYLCMPKPSDMSSSTTSTSSSSSSSSSDASTPTTPPATDCRTTGCGTSETCIFVKQGYLCMPKPTDTASSDAHPAPTPAPGTPSPAPHPSPAATSSPCPESSQPAPSHAPAPAPSWSSSPSPAPDSHPAPSNDSSWQPDSNSGSNPSSGQVSDKVTGSMESAAILSLLREIKADIAALKEDVNKIKVKIGA